MERNEKGQFTKGSGIHDLSKQRFGQLEVIELAEICNKRSFWLCKCDCGNTKIVRSDALISHKTVSCGCLKKMQTVNHMRTMVDVVFAYAGNGGLIIAISKNGLSKMAIKKI